MPHLAKVNGGSNGGFRPEEMHRREFQRTTFETLNRQAAAISDLDTRVTAAGEFLADQSVRIDDHGKALEQHDRMFGKTFAAYRAQLEAENPLLSHSSLWTRLRWLLIGR